MRYVLFGTGDYFKRFRHWFDDLEVVAVLDNDKKKQQTIMDGYIVSDPSIIIGLEYDVVVILSFYVTEMKKQLIDLGVSSDKIFHFFDIHELFDREKKCSVKKVHTKSILLLSHDLISGGPELALYHAAIILKKAGYEVVFASMIDGELKDKLEESLIPVIIDRRLQISTMRELEWTNKFDLVVCNTINFNVFLSSRDVSRPVIWWLHDSSFFYEGIKSDRLIDIDTENMKIVSVGPIPGKAMNLYRQDVLISDLIYGVSDGI
ncbi:Glycosyl-transferase family 4 [Lachnospiraceae bacterium]|nr:Glycosyl-transferase family 4 [Lachnospiraceae bacterium]